MRILKAVLMRMPSSAKRVQKITERAQGNLKGDVMESKLAIIKKSTGSKRGPYKPRSRMSDEREVLSDEGVVREFKGERYCVLGSGNLLKEEWKDIFYWYAGGKAPDDWIN